MDLREIQALHAQYTAQPVIIDIASHTAAMPALPAPERGATIGTRAVDLVSGLRKAGKPALVALAIAAVAATGGMSIARIWRAMHETVTTPAVVAVSGPAKQAPIAASEATGDMPINVTPPHPLTSKDFDPGRPVTQYESGLSNVDPRALTAATNTPPADHTASVARPVEQSVAAASPIRMQRPSAPTAPPVATPASVPSQPSPTAAAPTGPVAQPAQTKTPVTAPAPAPEQEKSGTRATLRPLHHITRRPAATPGNEASPEPAAPAQPKAPPGKSGDVQLF
jgi:hypothetical protein